MGEKKAASFRRELLGWYDRNRRDLPWRRTRDPYRIWLSEIMLQQTRVAAVLEHYRIFLERFPNLETLAAAREEDVLAAWSGLGYYRRARMLHQCARELVGRRGGEFPRRADELQALPGIGRYTAAAIASIVFSEPAAVVDGNVERVLERVTGKARKLPEIWRWAQGVLDQSRPGDFNQAMMELGATVCLPREPRCAECPVRAWCVTRGESPPTKKTVRQTKREIWCTLECAGFGKQPRAVRLVRRAASDPLMAGMWELPQSAVPPKPPGPEWRKFQHSITVTSYTVHVLRKEERTRRRSGRRSGRGEWVAVDRLLNMPLTGLTRKILKAGRII